MPIPQLKAEDILIGDPSQVRNNAQLFVTDEVATGLNIAPRLKFLAQEGRRYNFYKRNKTSKELFDEGLTPDISEFEVADGAQLLEVSGTELTPDSEVIINKGFRYIVPISDLEDSPESFLQDIEDMSYAISVAIESSATTKLLAEATSAGVSLADGVWSTSTKIKNDLRNFKSAFRKKGVRGPLDTLFYNGTNQDELANYIMDTEGNQNLQEDGDVINYSSIDNIYVEDGLSEGSTIGWSSQSQPATIVYRKIPGAYTPIQDNTSNASQSTIMKDGTQGYLPIINMKVVDSDAGGLEDVREFRFGAHWTVAVQRPGNIFYQTGI